MNSPLLPLLLLLAVLPLAAARPAYTQCVSNTTYAANSFYEANLRRLAAVLPAAASVTESPYVYQAVGFWPNRVAGYSFCRRRPRRDNGSSEHGRYSSPCGACVAGAFRELESACPHHKEAFFSDRNCILAVNDVRMFETEGIYGLIFQAIGFSWLFFLLAQEWRGRKKGIAVFSTPPLVDGGDLLSASTKV